MSSPTTVVADLTVAAVDEPGQSRRIVVTSRCPACDRGFSRDVAPETPIAAVVVERCQPCSDVGHFGRHLLPLVRRRRNHHKV